VALMTQLQVFRSFSIVEKVHRFCMNHFFRKGLKAITIHQMFGNAHKMNKMRHLTSGRILLFIVHQKQAFLYLASSN
jgi:hypothetical protein